MSLKRSRPTTSSRRLRSDVIYEVDKKRPEKSLIVPLHGPAGRSKGRISTRHKMRGAKKFLRIIDFKRNKKDIPAKVFALEYAPTHGPNIALLHYADGEKRYILAPQGLKKGDVVESGEKVEIKVGNAMPLRNIPIGTFVHNIEICPGRGGQLVRAAGCGAVIMSADDKFTTLKFPSREIRKILSRCFATIGALTNEDLKNVKMGKAGRKIHLGIRPTVRGVAMPYKHPHGGSYSTTGVGRKSPVSPWGQPAKGKKTRRRKQTNKYILQRRRKK